MFDSYARLSKMPDTGELEKIDTQLADNKKVIKRAGGVLGEELDDGLSAWRRRVRRPGWDRLLERVKSGESDGIVVWHLDRLFRQPRDLETLIDLADKGFRVLSAHGARNLSDPDDRFILRIEVAHAARSSDDTSRRIKRRFATKRENGVGYIGGPRRFGWPGKDQTWSPGPEEKEEDRPEVPAEQVEREREALRTGTDEALAGVGQSAIAEAWNAQGLRTAAGRELVADTVKIALLRPLNAGLIEHEGKLIGRMPGEPIVDPKKFERLRALFAGRRRGRVAGEVGQRYVGTGILRCAKCGRKLSARSDPRRTYTDYREGLAGQYFCNKGRRGCGTVFADRGAIDHELKLLVIQRLSDDRHAEAIAAARARVSERLAQVTKEIAECEKIQKALSARLGARKMSLDAFDEANDPLVEDLAKLRAEHETLSGGAVAGPTVAQQPGAIAAQWDAGDVAERRGLLLQALGRRLLVVHPSRRTGKRVFDRDRLKMINSEDLPGRTA